MSIEEARIPGALLERREPRRVLPGKTIQTRLRTVADTLVERGNPRAAFATTLSTYFDKISVPWEIFETPAQIQTMVPVH